MTEFNDVALATGSLVGAASLLAIGVKRWVKSMTELGAETDVVANLRKEVSRLAEQNASLAKMLNTLQNEIFALREEHDAVKRENAEFRHMLREVGNFPDSKLREFAESKLNG